MKVGNTGTVTTAYYRRRKPSGAEKSGFSDAVHESDDTRATAATTDVAAMNSLLSIQEVDDPLAERKKSLKRGEDILSELDGLRHGILAGAYSAEKLERLLSVTKRQGEAVSDPALREIIGEIELRAAEELAKLGKTH